jgi:ribosomal protein S18 acetylase RimI-like enzyme
VLLRASSIDVDAGLTPLDPPREPAAPQPVGTIAFLRAIAPPTPGLAGFDCGNDALNQWLVEHAVASQKADLARTYLALGAGAVAGYVSLTTGSIRPEAAPKRYARGMPRHAIPTILIARLAVDRRYQAQRIGSRLLAEALRLAVAASDTAAARLVVVDAIDDQAAGFYRRWGFLDVPENPHRLFRKISDIRRSLEDR